MFRRMSRDGQSLHRNLSKLWRMPIKLSVLAIVGMMMAATTATAQAQDPPAIYDFYCINNYGDYWTLTGVVVDNDDSVDGDVITFGGVLSSYGLTAEADADGVFSIDVNLSGLSQGQATAVTQDSHGAQSDTAWYWIWL